jgi:hypothetical protein
MARNNSQKGKDLEKAVMLIQDMILKSDPLLKGSKFTIEANKIVKVKNVHHEIDVLVKTLPGSPYEAVFIFECKNWNRKVDKETVMHLAGKVEELCATRGFLVAHDITKDARAYISNNEKLSFEMCAQDFLNPVGFDLMHIVHDVLGVRLFFKLRGVNIEDHPAVLDVVGRPCLLKGISIELDKLIHEEVQKLANVDQERNGNLYKNPGSHHSECNVEHCFDQNSFRIGEHDIEKLTIHASFMVGVKPGKLVSQFEIKNRGRVYSLETEPDDKGKSLKIDLVHPV